MLFGHEKKWYRLTMPLNIVIETDGLVDYAKRHIQARSNNSLFTYIDFAKRYLNKLTFTIITWFNKWNLLNINLLLHNIEHFSLLIIICLFGGGRLPSKCLYIVEKINVIHKYFMLVRLKLKKSNSFLRL